MKTSIAIAVIGLVVLNASLVAEAEPAQGAGYFGGFAHNTDAVVAFNDEYTSSGFAFGVDYQLPMGEAFSVNPFIRGDFGSVSGGAADGFTAEHFLLGAEGRWWFADQGFVGGALTFIDETLTQESGSTLFKNSGSGIAIAISAGGEIELSESGNLIIQMQVWSAPGLGVFPDTDVDLRSIRLEIGYRQKRR